MDSEYSVGNIKYRGLGVDKKVTDGAKLWTRSIAHPAHQRVVIDARSRADDDRCPSVAGNDPHPAGSPSE